jgi:hypothetical protein
MSEDEDVDCCDDCGRPAYYFCELCQVPLCGQCKVAHDEQHEWEDGFKEEAED